VYGYLIYCLLVILGLFDFAVREHYFAHFHGAGTAHPSGAPVFIFRFLVGLLLLDL
jgi:hypothetical protein